jgi:hypothetical protein
MIHTSGLVKRYGEVTALDGLDLPQPEVWSLENPVAYALIWVVIILAIFVPLAVRQYKKAARP